MDAQRYRQIIADVFDGMECLESCDSFGHAEDCPAVDGPAAFRKLRARVDSLQLELCGLEQMRVRDNQHLIEVRDALRARVEELEGLLRESRRQHFVCSLCTDECGSFDGRDCGCGAEDWNAKVEAALRREGE